MLHEIEDLSGGDQIDWQAYDAASYSPTPDIVTAARGDLWDAVEAGRLHLPIDRTFSLDEAAAAQEHMRRNGHFGKIVLTV